MEEQDTIQKVVELLEQTRSDHHRAFSETDGYDPEWPAWYAQHLHERVNALLGSSLTEGEIAEQLSALDKEHQDQAPDVNWAEYYARALLKWAIKR
jgi:hypothetical protein